MKKFLCLCLGLGLGLLLLLVAMSSGCRSNDRLPSESGTPSFDDEPHEERIVYDSLTIAEEDLVHLEYWQNDFPLKRIEPVRFYTQDGLMPFFYCLTEEMPITAYTDQFCRQEMKYNAHDIVHRYEQELYHRARLGKDLLESAAHLQLPEDLTIYHTYCINNERHSVHPAVYIYYVTSAGDYIYFNPKPAEEDASKRSEYLLPREAFLAFTSSWRLTAQLPMQGETETVCFSQEELAPLAPYLVVSTPVTSNDFYEGMTLFDLQVALLGQTYLRPIAQGMWFVSGQEESILVLYHDHVRIVAACTPKGRAPYRGEISSLYLYCDTFDEVFLKLGIPNAGVTNHTANYRTTDGRLFEIDVQYFEAENREWTYYYGYREITDLQV